MDVGHEHVLMMLGLVSGLQCGNQMRDNHTRRGPSEGVRPEEDVAQPKWNHQEHPEWHSFQGAYSGGEHPQAGARLEATYCGRQVRYTNSPFCITQFLVPLPFLSSPSTPSSFDPACALMQMWQKKCGAMFLPRL